MTERLAGSWPAERSGPGEPRRTVTISDLIRIPLHRPQIVGALAAIGLLAAVFYLVLIPPSVNASAVVAVRPVVTDAFTYPGAGADRSVNMNVEAGIATSTDVLRKIADTNGDDPMKVRTALEVEIPTGGQILRFTYTGTTMDEVVATVNLAAETYLQVRHERYEEQRAGMLASYDASIEKVAIQQTAVQRMFTRSQGGAADAALAQLNSINNQLVELNTARAEIAAVDVSPGWVTQSAERPMVASSGGGRFLYPFAGLLGGALLGVLLTYLRESMDRRVRTAADAQEATGLPLMGTVRRRGFRVKAHAVDADVRYVAMAIAEKFGQQEIPTPVVVISARAREDTTPMAASLAVALASEGRNVYVGDDSGRLRKLREVLMTDRRRVPSRPFIQQEANPSEAPTQINTPVGIPAGRETAEPIVIRRRPSPHPAGGVGLAQSDPDATVTFPRISGGQHPTAGRQQANPGGQQSNSAGPGSNSGGLNPVPVTMAKVTVPTLPPDAVTVGTGVVRTGSYQNAPESDIVLFNAPPAESDERGVREARDGTAIVVVERDRTRVADLRRLVDRLRASGAEPLGFVLTRCGRG